MASTPRIIEGTLTCYGYRRIEGCNPDGKRQTAFVHTLVLLAFVGPPPQNCVCRHLDDNGLNNCLPNLIWGTQLENVADRYIHGTSKPAAVKIQGPPICNDDFIPIEAILPFEVWRPVKGAIGYDVSNWGRIRSYWRNGEILETPCRMLDPYQRPDGYYIVGLMMDVNSQKTVLLHRIVLETFSPRWHPDLICRHLNGNPSDNHLSNLRWGTKLENNLDKATHGTQLKGSQIHNAKLDEDKVREIRRRFADGELGAHLAVEFGVSHAIITCLIKRRTWKHVV